MAAWRRKAYRVQRKTLTGVIEEIDNYPVELRQLRYFITVAEELSFTRAAARLFAAQSTVSAAVRVLEEELQVSLFDRSTRAVALSPAGEAFLPEAKSVVVAAERARKWSARRREPCGAACASAR